MVGATGNPTHRVFPTSQTGVAMKYFHFRVSGTIELETCVAEEDTRQTDTGVAPIDKSMRELEKEIESLLDKAHAVRNVSLDHFKLERIEEAD